MFQDNVYKINSKIFSDATKFGRYTYTKILHFFWNLYVLLPSEYESPRSFDDNFPLKIITVYKIEVLESPDQFPNPHYT